MKKLKKFILTLTVFLISILSTSFPVLASDITDSLKRAEYSQEYMDWLDLSEEEKQNVLMPRVYQIPYTKAQEKNPLGYMKTYKAALTRKYSLRDIIPNNVVIRDQQETNTCWAFAGIATLESNIAFLNYKNGNTSKTYDYSERHAEYATSRVFANNEENSYGYNRKVGSGGNWYLIQSYLTNGSGAIAEAEMPFENNEDKISLSQIKNKTISTQVYDTRDFYNVNTEQATIEEMKNEMKEHIQNYGAIYAGLHGASLLSDCYNNDTGAIYCSDSTRYPANHAIAIIGWDDDYAIENFNEGARPTSKGAWIIKNSWGEKLEFDLQEMKQEIFNTYPEECKNNGWSDASAIPNAFIVSMGYMIENDKAYLKIGDNGFMYVSYEDVNIYTDLSGIQKASDKVNYENIYQYDEFYPFYWLTCLNSKIMLCNVFDKKTEGREYLTQVSIYAPETYTCKVYVNPNGTSKDKKDLQQASLKAGETETFEAGYHTIEFSEPIEIKADSFAVVIEIQGARTDESEIMVALESNRDSIVNGAKVEIGKCFLTVGNDLENCKWKDLGSITEENANLIDGDSSIKAFTVSQVEEDFIESIEITTPPTKTKYIEGENFDETGMVVTAKYNSGKSEVITDYIITNGIDLKTNQKSITISYEGKTVEQPITVEKKKDGNQEEENPVAKNSNFDDASCQLDSMKLYIFSDNSAESYIRLDVTINGFVKQKENDSYEYYYYLSGNKNETNITDWVKVREEQTSDNKLQFKMSTKDIKNLEEIQEVETLYLYVKEVVKKGESEATVTSKAMELNTNIEDNKVEIYIDNQKINLSDIQINGGNGSQNNGPQQANGTNNVQRGDQTVTNKQLPKTGIQTIFVLIVVISITGIVLYIRYKNLNKYIK